MCWKSSLKLLGSCGLFSGAFAVKLAGSRFSNSPNFSCQRRALPEWHCRAKKNPASPRSTPPKKTLLDQQKTRKWQTLQLSFLLVIACLKKKKCFMKQTSLDVPNSYSYKKLKFQSIPHYQKFGTTNSWFFSTHIMMFVQLLNPPNGVVVKKKRTENPGVDSHPFFRGIAP